MATEQKTADFLTEQMSAAGNVRNRKMFGEYAVYCDEKVVALICDEQLFIKPTTPGKDFIGEIREAPPYPGAKPYFLIDSALDDRDLLAELFRATEREVPEPKTKKSKNSKNPKNPKKKK
jgi:TfoX/Sxy family transcriptional regulator of competence genes